MCDIEVHRRQYKRNQKKRYKSERMKGALEHVARPQQWRTQIQRRTLFDLVSVTRAGADGAQLTCPAIEAPQIMGLVKPSFLTKAATQLDVGSQQGLNIRHPA